MLFPDKRNERNCKQYKTIVQSLSEYEHTKQSYGSFKTLKTL
jgi:hypothetical protein